MHMFSVRFLLKLGRGLAHGLFSAKNTDVHPAVGAENVRGSYESIVASVNLRHRITCQPLDYPLAF